MSLRAEIQSGTGDETPQPSGQLWKAVRGHLDSVKARIVLDIQNYPPPIPACDAQFNHLLEQRDVIDEEIRNLELFRQNDGFRPDPAAAIDRYMSGSRFFDAETRRRILRQS